MVMYEDNSKHARQIAEDNSVLGASGMADGNSRSERRRSILYGIATLSVVGYAIKGLFLYDDDEVKPAPSPEITDQDKIIKH